LSAHAPTLTPWLPLIAIAFNIELPPTPEVEMLAEANRRAKVHESVRAFLRIMLPETALIEIENAHHMDEASAAFLSYLTERIDSRPWLFAVARRPMSGGFTAPDAPTVVRIDLKPIAAADALRLTQIATKETPLPPHVLDLVATRSGGNPQFLRDLLRIAIESDGKADLPDSAEAAAMARIDGLAPEDRAVVRRAAVFGITFHPRMLAWFADETEGPPPDPGVWNRLADLFDEEPDGYMRFRRSLLRDAAYAALPFKVRRRLHGAVAAHLEEELDYPEEAAGILSLHYHEAGEYQRAWRYGKLAAEQAYGVYAYVEAAGLYSRALESGRKLTDLAELDLSIIQQSLGDSWYRAGQFPKASDAYLAARGSNKIDPLRDAALLLNLSHVEAKVGNFEQALRRCDEARTVLGGLDGAEPGRQAARAGGWYAMVLTMMGKMNDAIDWGERTVTEAEAASDQEALADAYFAMGIAYGELGKEEGLTFMKRSLEAYQRAGNVEREAQTLSTLGSVCHWAGRWDEALTYWDRGREEALKIGDTVGAAHARINMAEILTDRGEWAEAEVLLVETLPLWKASQYRFYLGHCLWYLGRVLLRLGRVDDALRHLEEAKSNLLAVGAEEAVPAIDAWIADCHIGKGNEDAALELARSLLDRASESNGVAKIVPLLERVQAHALLLQGDLWGARDALERSLAAARDREELFEVALTSLSLIEIDRLEGVEPAIEIVNESRSLLANLKVRAVPPVPVPAA
jgi:tetratricopeptide (TPR) repeat protein